MGYQVIKQPDGDYAIFSSYTDTIVIYDADVEDVEKYFVDIAIEIARRDIQRVLGHVVAGEPRKAYYQFALTWDEALEMDREHDGEVWQIKTATAGG